MKEELHMTRPASQGELLARFEGIHGSIAENLSYTDPVVDTGFGDAKTLPEPATFVDTGATSKPAPKRSRSLRVPPLVCLGKDGKRYKRPRHIKAQLRWVFALDRSQWLGLAGRLENETLVCLVRLTHDDDPLFSGCLLKKLQTRIRYRASRFCGDMDPYDTQMFVETVEHQVLALILAKQPNWAEWGVLEVAFGRAVKNLAINEFDKFERSTAGNIAELRVDAGLVDGLAEDEQVERPIEFVQDNAPGPEDSLLNLDLGQRRHRKLQKALQAVENPWHRLAAILHWGHDIPVHSSKRGRDCLTRQLRKDAGTIRYWLETAMKQMRAALGVKK
jgi:hypothetical protein